PTGALAADPNLGDKVDGKITTMAAFRRSEDPDDWKRLMSEHLIRRTRSFIRANHALVDGEGKQYLAFADGQQFRFPDRIATPINHSFGPDDPRQEPKRPPGHITQRDDLAKELLILRSDIG